MMTITAEEVAKIVEEEFKKYLHQTIAHEIEFNYLWWTNYPDAEREKNPWPDFLIKEIARRIKSTNDIRGYQVSVLDF